MAVTCCRCVLVLKPLPVFSSVLRSLRVIMQKFIRAVVFLLIPAVSMAAAQSSDQNVGLRKNVPNVWALRHATVVVRPGEVVNDATVVIRDGKVSSVTSAGTPPVDARLIDLTGKTVYAGFIDAYAEVKLSSDGLNRTARHWNSNVTPQLSVAQQSGGTSENEQLRMQVSSLSFAHRRRELFEAGAQLLRRDRVTPISRFSVTTWRSISN